CSATSEAGNANGRPVKPPMPNIGINAIANIMGTVKRIEPPHRDSIRQVMMITDGMEMMVVVVWKNIAMPAPMPVTYMWCAQTTIDKKPMANTEATNER